MMVTTAAAGIAAEMLPFLRVPARASWPFAVASTFFQIPYLLLVARTYRVADMSRAYPLMRGTAPLIVALVSSFGLGDALSPIAWIGVMGICLGIVSIALSSQFQDREGLSLALLNAFFIAAYTLIDGAGVRRSHWTPRSGGEAGLGCAGCGTGW